MANSLLTINMITREAVRLWKNTNAFIQHIDTQYDPSFAQTGAKIGTTLKVRLPNDYTVRIGPAASIQDTVEQSASLTLNNQYGVDVSFSSADRTMSLDDYSRRVLAPAVNATAGAIAQNIMAGVETGICNLVANLDGSNNLLTPNAGTYLTAGAALDINSAPTGDRKIVNDPFTNARVVDSLKGLFNPDRSISAQYKSGMMQEAVGFDWMKDQTVIKHTTGTANQTVNTVNGGGQTGQTITVNAITGTYVAGDIVTLTGVNAVNRITKATTGSLRQFVVTATAAANATSISIYPAIIPGGAGYNATTGAGAVQYQTVDVSPANGAYVNTYNMNQGTATVTYRKNFGYAPDAVTMATADLELPKGVHEAARDEFDGLAMRMITAYDVKSDQMITRLDVLWGVLYVRPEWACIVPDVI